MIYYTPVPVQEHDELLGSDFSNRFGEEMQVYYAPFANKGRPIQISKETWEYAVADAIPGGEWKGAGKNVIDVSTPTINIDVKGLSCGSLKSTSTEASILQNNKLSSDNFTSLFSKSDFTGLNEMFVEPLANKVRKAGKLYVLCAIRHKLANDKFDVYYCMYKVEEKTNKQFINEMYMDAKRSVSVPMIDPTYGKTYLYIPKRRLELRVNMLGMKDYLVYSHSQNG